MDQSSQIAAVAPELVGRSTSAATAAKEIGLTRAGALRLDAIDMLRGLVIVLMVLDHVRDFLHAPAFLFSATDLTQTNPLLFMTRWVTHLCAPTFVFLSGVSIFMQRANGKAPGELSKFLLTRGLWLILLELTVIGFGFNMGPPLAFMQVIWAIGASMVLMAAVVRLPAMGVLALGAFIIIFHPIIAGAIRPDAPGALWFLTMQPGPPVFMRGFVPYPLIPWFGIMCLGYGLGFIFRQPGEQRRRSVLALAMSFLAAFVVLRAINGYGDPAPWSVQSSGIMTLLSFINVSKYPPSLMYVLATLGVSMLLFLALEKLTGPLQRLFLAFGRTSMFTYILHIYLVHCLAIVIGALGGIPVSYYIDFLLKFQNGGGQGFGLAVVYAVWLSTILMLYPLSSRFARVKRERRDWWLSYI
ncbi:MAG: heparan-alpha-glucosaminide N-acetyltransferase domain-containing protein [Steroidobacter sp.]